MEKSLKDLRGYTQEYGWAHSVAHTADTFDELALCDEIGHNELSFLLEIIRDKISTGDYIFIHNEDERLVTAIIRILSREIISIDNIIEWIISFRDFENTDDFEFDYNRKVNVKNFLRSFYFRILDQKRFDDILEELKRTIVYISRYN